MNALSGTRVHRKSTEVPEQKHAPNLANLTELRGVPERHNVCDLSVCDLSVWDFKVCDLRVCDLSVCDFRVWDLRVCDIGVLLARLGG